MGWREDELLSWIARTADGAALDGSVGHDAAVCRRPRSRTVMCVDQTLETVHFEPGTSARLVATKAVGRALSDLAATAARPRQVLLSIAAPAEVEAGYLRGLVTGARKRAAEFGAALVGGDLARSPGRLALAVTAVGELEGRRRAPGRDRARAGQLLLCTGPTGGSRLGRHLRVQPRIEEGAWLHANGATAMMDISDGLALDLSRIARASGVRLELDEVRVHRDARRMARESGRDPREHALGDGEDHELVATIPSARWRAVEKAARRRFPDLAVIGRVRRGSGLHVRDADGELRAHEGQGGWIHG